METLKVLVVDDEPGIRSGVMRILRNYQVSYPFMDEDFDFEVLEAESGETALTILNEHHPHIVLLDNKLPGIQGMEVLEYIKENQLNSVVVMITSYASLEIAIKAKADGAYDFIPKPFTPQELKASLDNITKQLFLKRMTKNMTEQGRQVRFQFLSVLSHELKAPLNAIEGYMNIMKEKELGERLDAYDNIIERTLARINGMRSLIMDLLDLTKVSFEKKEAKQQVINLFDLAKMAIGTVQPFAIQCDVSVKLECDPSTTLFADPTDIEIIMNNLISNAVKYNKRGGEVLIRVFPDGDFLTMTFKDSGIGMNPEDLDHLFKDFFRAKNEKTRNITGSGLGLSIVKKVVDLYKGSITVESEPDKGSSFIVKLPVN